MEALELPFDLGRHRLVGLLGRGGMGAVYRAALRSDAGSREGVTP